jgi:hypothetical protein
MKGNVMSFAPFVARLRRLLVAAAREGSPRAYSEYAALLGLDRSHLPHLRLVVGALKDIMREDHRRGRPYAAVAAVSLASNVPGWGFAELAWELGRFSPNDDYRAFVTAEWGRFRAFCLSQPAPQVA